jgi:phage tail tube protein FII
MNNHLGVNIMAGAKIYDDFYTAFGYNIPDKNLKALSKGSFEITVGYRFGKQKNSTLDYKQSSTKNEIEKLKDLTQQQFEIIDKLQVENEKLVTQLKENSDKVDSHEEEINRLRDQYEKDKAELDQVRIKYEVSLDQIDEKEQNENETPEHKYFVVLGAYKKIADAKAFQRILMLNLQLNSELIEREDGKYIFVCSGSFNEKKGIKEEFKRLKKLDLDAFISGNVWIHQVK